MATHHADTSTSTGSLWTAAVDVPVFPPLEQDLRVDVCIVGGGIVGINTAYMLTRAGKSVALLEDGSLASGMSSMTTAHLTCVLDDRYFDIERIHGEEGARRAAASHMTAINRIETIVASEGIECDFERLNGYLFLSPGDEEDLLHTELAAAQRAGVDVALVDSAPRPSLETGRCLLFPNQAQFHPVNYIAGLARAIQRDGGRIFTMTHAEKIEGGALPQVAAGGHVITANAVVVATHAPINTMVALHTKQTGYLSYVIGATVPRGSVMRALYWDTGFPYHYARIHGVPPIGGGHTEILIVGGEDHRTGQSDDTTQNLTRLEHWARGRFPFITDIPYTWSGQVMQSIDGLAFIGRSPDEENVFVVTGDSGTGMTYATVAAILITDLIEARENPWETLYDPSRKTLRTAPAFAGEAMRTASQYLDWVIPGDVGSEDEVAPDSGAVLKEGLAPVALYREPDGTLHRLSAVCVHLGCIVKWNAAERTWDCPCHGSRYDRFGTVINGPANSNLPPR